MFADANSEDYSACMRDPLGTSTPFGSDLKGVTGRRKIRVCFQLLCVWFVLAGGKSSAARTASPEGAHSVVRTTASILALPEKDVVKRATVEVKGTVTWANLAIGGLVVHDRTGGIWVDLSRISKPLNVSPGSLIRVYGKVNPGRFAPDIRATRIQVDGHGPLPHALPVSYENLSSGLEDDQYVMVKGTITDEGPAHVYSGTELIIQLREGHIEALLPASESMQRLVGARVRISGTALNSVNDVMQTNGVILAVAGWGNLHILKGVPENLFEAPIVSLSNLMRYRSGTDYFHRIRVEGALTYCDPGFRLVLQQGKRSIEVVPSEYQNLEPGDRVSAVGFLSHGSVGPVLRDAVLRVVKHGTPPKPISIVPEEASSSRYSYSLISVTMRLLSVVEEPRQTLFLLQNENTFIKAELNRRVSLPRNIKPGSIVRVVGIDRIAFNGGLVYQQSSAHPTILLSSIRNVKLITPAPWWTPARLFDAIAVLAVLTSAFLLLFMYSNFRRWKTEAASREREKLARDIHDTLAQSFAGIGFQIRVIRKTIMGSTGTSENANLRRHLAVAEDLVRYSHREASRSFLSSPCLSEMPKQEMLETLQMFAEELIQGGPIQVDTHLRGKYRPLRGAVQSELYCIGKEAILNAIRHGDPTRILISLNYQENSVSLVLSDNGRGFVVRGDLLGFGIRGMRKRASEIGAEFEIVSAPGRGTTITVNAISSGRKRSSSWFVGRIRKSAGKIGLDTYGKQTQPVNTDIDS